MVADKVDLELGLNPGFETKAGSLVRISAGEQAHVHTN